MKIIELNIGLSTPQGKQINFVSVLNALTGRGFTLITYRVQTSVCKDGEEKCLAVKCEAPDDWQTQLRTLSDKLGQDCIAIVGFIGHAPYDAFCPSLWVEPSKVESKPDLEAFQFIGYLEHTLLPDLEAGGYEATAEDFKTLISFYRRK